MRYFVSISPYHLRSLPSPAPLLNMTPSHLKTVRTQCGGTQVDPGPICQRYDNPDESATYELALT